MDRRTTRGKDMARFIKNCGNEHLKTTTYSDNTPGVLTTDNIRNAINILRKYSEQAYCERILQSDEIVQRIFPIELESKFVGFHSGINVYTDESVPKNTLRFVMSDGTFKDITV